MSTPSLESQLWPLLSGSLKVTEVRLVKPVIHLEIDKQGRGNWLFAPATPGAAGATVGGFAAPAQARGTQQTAGGRARVDWATREALIGRLRHVRLLPYEDDIVSVHERH